LANNWAGSQSAKLLAWVASSLQSRETHVADFVIWSSTGFISSNYTGSCRSNNTRCLACCRAWPIIGQAVKVLNFLLG